MSPATLQLPADLLFTAPPPGLEPRVDFSLAAIENATGLFSITAADGAARLYVLDAAIHLPEYTPRLAAADLAGIGTDRTGATVLVVVNPGTRSTVNLAAPILVNSETGACAQVILEGSEWPLRAPLNPA